MLLTLTQFPAGITEKNSGRKELQNRCQPNEKFELHNLIWKWILQRRKSKVVFGGNENISDRVFERSAIGKI